MRASLYGSLWRDKIGRTWGEPDSLSTRAIALAAVKNYAELGTRGAKNARLRMTEVRIGLTSAPRFRLRGEPAFFGFLLAGELGQLIGNRHYHTLRGEEFSLRFAFEVEEFRHGSGHGGQAQI